VEPPGADLPLIILFAAPVLARDETSAETPRRYGSFVAGLYDRHTIVGSSGRMAGIQANFSPIGARLLLGRPLDAFANRMVQLEDVWGAEATGLTAELADAPTWAARFERLDCHFIRRIAAASPVHPSVAWALERLLQTRGQIRIDSLVQQIGWSRRHLIERVHHEFGLAPKTLARVLRLGHAVSLLRRDGAARLAEVAADSGYYDQAHFTRDFREFTGMTPGAFLKSRLPDGGGISAG
jgi:AraC-like DNA-binding protein